jgi:hypothetical protein
MIMGRVNLGLLLFIGAIFLIAGAACSRKTPTEAIEIDIPPGFNGNFVLEMGVKNAPQLQRDGDAYVVNVPKDGKVSTSTLLQNPKVSFKNAGDGAVWGYSHSSVSTGDGISVGGRIEFFVGTKKDFDAQENKKNQSGSFVRSADMVAHI